MKRHHSIVSVACAALFTFGGIVAVSAQMRMGAPTEPPQMMRDMMSQDCPMAGMMASGQEARIDARLADLKSQIGITSEQNSVWTAYTTAVKQSGADMSSRHMAMMQSMQAKTPIERLDGEIAAIENRAGHLKATKSALVMLFDALTLEQKTKANAMLAAHGCGM